MKRIRINDYERGLVYRNGNYIEMLRPGVYWISSWKDVRVHSIIFEFPVFQDIDVLLADAEFRTDINLVEVRNNEIALRYQNGIFQKVLTPGRYVYWIGPVEYDIRTINLNKVEMITEVGSGIDKSVLAIPAVMNYIRFYNVESYEKAVMYINGKFERVLDPGVYYFWKNPTPITVVKADMRTVNTEISGQEILTRDKASLRINFNVQYRVTDIVKALVENKEFDKQLYVATQLALRTFVGAFTLDELLEKKEIAPATIVDSIRNKSENLGVEIVGAGIRDIILPGDMKEIMNKVLIAEKTAQANVIMRREETASTRSLLNAAKLMEDNLMLYRLKEMEFVEKIAGKIDSITLNNGNLVGDQLKKIFVPGNN